jgi:hypothetical protein
MWVDCLHLGLLCSAKGKTISIRIDARKREECMLNRLSIIIEAIGRHEDPKGSLAVYFGSAHPTVIHAGRSNALFLSSRRYHEEHGESSPIIKCSTTLSLLYCF